MSVSYLRKANCIGNHYKTGIYSYDPTRMAFVDRFFERGTEKGIRGDGLVAYIRNKFISTFGKDDYFLNQLEDTVWRKLRRRKTREPQIYDELFAVLFHLCLQQGVRGEERINYLREGLIENFGEGDYDDYIEDGVERILHNYNSRKKLFKDKSFLNEWTHFVTITYSDENFSNEADFRYSIKRTLNNFATRRGWRYMAVFERGKNGEDDEGRLHVHALCNIPDGQMPGTTEIVSRYSFKKKCRVKCHENSFFKETYGINDFEPLAGVNISWDNIKNDTVHYILKYMFKDAEKVIYSRGVPSSVFKEISDDDIVAPIRIRLSNFVTQWLLFDDVFSDEMSEVDNILINDGDPSNLAYLS